MAGNSEYALVSQADAALWSYPYVFVNADGSVRELHRNEREYLETPFAPSDGGRPYVKSSYDDKDGWGSISGFCHRSKIPADQAIAAAPAEDPNPPMSREEHIAWLRSKMVGFDVVDNPDGTISMTRRTDGHDV